MGPLKGKGCVQSSLPLEKIVSKPVGFAHTPSELDNLAKYLISLEGASRIIMGFSRNNNYSLLIFLNTSCMFSHRIILVSSQILFSSQKRLNYSIALAQLASTDRCCETDPR